MRFLLIHVLLAAPDCSFPLLYRILSNIDAIYGSYVLVSDKAVNTITFYWVIRVACSGIAANVNEQFKLFGFWH